jgi:hypothetical protein
MNSHQVVVAKTCESITELRDRMAALRGKTPVPMRFYPPAAEERSVVDAVAAGSGSAATKLLKLPPSVT